LLINGLEAWVVFRNAAGVPSSIKLLASVHLGQIHHQFLVSFNLIFDSSGVVVLA
jgi:hypothetical protein